MGWTELLERDTTSEDRQPVGWTQDPNGRGTSTIILSCLSTTVLCTWVVIHARIDVRPSFRILHKLALSLKAVIAPELIAVEAAQEWTQARRIMGRCSKYTNGEMKFVHAFYIGMFGIRYRTLEYEVFGARHCTRVLWPTQFVWLLEQGIVRWKDHQDWGLSEELLYDRSNADSAAKFIAVCGVAKFTIDSLVRIGHGLPLAPLESMTLGYIPLFALTYFFWWLKPKDIDVPTIVDLPLMSAEAQKAFESLSLSEAFDDEGKPQQTSYWGILRLTPRDFEGDLYRTRDQNLPSRFGQGKVLSHWDPDLYHSKLRPIACLFGMSFGALHLISWNAFYPSTLELWLWRSSAIISMAALLVFMQFERVILRWKDPVTWISISSTLLYILSRFVAITEAFTSFRASDPAIYAT